MSSEFSALVGLYQTARSSNYVGMAASAFVLYDWAISLGREIHLVWRNPKTGAFFVYLFSRYIEILEIVFDLTTINPVSDQSCKVIAWADVVIFLLTLAYPACFSALRLYALTEQNKKLFAVTLVLGLMPFLVNLGQAYQTHVFNLPLPIGCLEERATTQAATVIFTLVARIPLIISDILVIAVTWTKLYKMARLVHDGVKGPTLHYVMLEGGTIYFVTLLMLNVLQITLQLLSIHAIAPDGSYASAFIDPITSVLISRFILNLRETNEQPDVSTTPSFVGLGLPDIEPSPFVDSLAGPVHLSSDLVFAHESEGGLAE